MEILFIYLYVLKTLFIAKLLFSLCIGEQQMWNLYSLWLRSSLAFWRQKLCHQPWRLQDQELSWIVCPYGLALSHCRNWWIKHLIVKAFLSPLFRLLMLFCVSLWRLGFLEPPAFEEGILERYPIFLDIVLNHISGDSEDFSHAVTCLRLLFEILGKCILFNVSTELIF